MSDQPELHSIVWESPENPDRRLEVEPLSQRMHRIILKAVRGNLSRGDVDTLEGAERYDDALRDICYRIVGEDTAKRDIVDSLSLDERDYFVGAVLHRSELRNDGKADLDDALSGEGENSPKS